MNYSVRWIFNAEAELTEIWLAAPDRQRVTDAAQRIEAILQSLPHDFGESRGPYERIGFIEPLAVQFLIDDRDQMVYVFHVRKYGPRR